MGMIIIWGRVQADDDHHGGDDKVINQLTLAMAVLRSEAERAEEDNGDFGNDVGGDGNAARDKDV